MGGHTVAVGVECSTSVCWKRGLDKGSDCLSSQHAVIGLTRTAVMEVGSRNIRVNAIAP